MHSWSNSTLHNNVTSLIPSQIGIPQINLFHMGNLPVTPIDYSMATLGQSHFPCSSPMQTNQVIDPVVLASGPTESSMFTSLQCPICGDKVSGYHYGLLTCESCKGFFKRVVQNQKSYHCPAVGQCPVSLTTRRRCSACRLRRCLEAGMQVNAVRGDRTRGGRSRHDPYFRPRASTSSSTAHLQPSAPVAPVAKTAPNNSLRHPGSLKREAWCAFEQQPEMSYTEEPIQPVKKRCPEPDPAIEEARRVQQHKIDLEETHRALLKTEEFSNWNRETAVQLLDSELVHVDLADRSSLLSALLNMMEKMLSHYIDWGHKLDFFKDISPEDQKCVLNMTWSEVLLIDYIHHSLLSYSDGSPLHKRLQLSSLELLDLLGLQDFRVRLDKLTKRLAGLQMDGTDFDLLKLLVLFNADVRTKGNQCVLQDCQQRICQSLHEYTQTTCPKAADKFGQLLLRLSEVKLVAFSLEAALVDFIRGGLIPQNSVLAELLNYKQDCFLGPWRDI